MRRAVFLAVVLALVSSPGWATKRSEPFPLGPDGEAESTVREMLSRDLSTVLTVKEKENDDKRFLSPDLLALFMADARDFDADPYTGVQDTGGFKLDELSSISVAPDRAIVSVQFSSSYDKTLTKIAYDVRKTGPIWRIYDITYYVDGRSMRQTLKRNFAWFC